MFLLAFASGAFLFLGLLSLWFSFVDPMIVRYAYTYTEIGLTHVGSSAAAPLAVGLGCYAIAAVRGVCTRTLGIVLLVGTVGWSISAAITAFFLQYFYLGTVLLPSILWLAVVLGRRAPTPLTSRDRMLVALALLGVLLGPVLLSLATFGVTGGDGRSPLSRLDDVMFRSYVAPVAVFLGVQLAALALVLGVANTRGRTTPRPRLLLPLFWLVPMLTAAAGVAILADLAVRTDLICIRTCTSSFFWAMDVFPIVLGVMNLAGLHLWRRTDREAQINWSLSDRAGDGTPP